MPLAPETRLREGDVVAVLATVTYAPKGRDERYVHLRVAEYHAPLILQPRDIDAVVRRSFKVGERVRHGASFATIRAVDGDSAWIKLDGAAQPFTTDLSDIELLDPVAEDGFDPEPLSPPVEPLAAEPSPIEI